jgi:hypothetical protein
VRGDRGLRKLNVSFMVSPVLFEFGAIANSVDLKALSQV